MSHRYTRRAALLGLLSMAASSALQAGFLTRDKDDELLPVDEALQLQPPLREAGRVILAWQIAPGCYLYRDKLEVEILDPPPARPAILKLPAGEAHEDAHFGTVRVLRGSVIAELPDAALRRLRVRYQGCADGRVCYPPQTRVLELPAP